MKKAPLRSFLCLFLGILALTITAPLCFASVSYSFDDYSNGSINGQGPWLLDSGTVSIDPAYDYDANGKGVRGNISGQYSGAYTSDISGLTSGLDTIDFYMKIDDATYYSKMRIHTTGGTENWIIGRSNVSGEYWRLQECVITCSNVAILSTATSVNTWRHLYFQGRTSDGKVRAKIDDGEWSEWGGSGVFRQIESLVIDGENGNHFFFDDITIGSATPPPPVNNLFFVEPYGTTTSDFRNWTLGIFTDQEYSTTVPKIFSIEYGTSTNFGFTDSHAYYTSPTQNATTGYTVFKTQPLENGQTYYFQGSFSTTSGSIIATTTINSITIDGSAGESYYNPISPESTTTASSFIECENFGWPINWLCDGAVYLFYPSAGSLNSLTGLWDAIKQKPPIGYLSVSVEALNLLTAEATSTLETPLYSLGEITTTIRTGIAVLFLILEVFYFVKRISNLDI